MIDRFLSTIWRPVGYGEIRAIDAREKRVAQAFFDLGDGYDKVVKHVEALVDQGNVDIYYGVMPRLRKRGRAEDTLPTTDVLWADLDDKTVARGKADLWRALALHPLTASILIDSGHGYHAYWLLRDLVPFEEASLAMKSIARKVGGDHTYDAARVLRLPGTKNYKDADDVLDVRVLTFNNRRYRWSDFERDEAVETSRQAISHATYIAPEGLPDWLDDLIRNGWPKGGRSEACFKVCLWLARFGWTDAQITDVFAGNPAGIGAKYSERKDGDRWLKVTLAAARARA